MCPDSSDMVLSSALVGASDELTSCASRSPGLRDDRQPGSNMAEVAATSAGAATPSRESSRWRSDELRGKPQVWLAGLDSGGIWRHLPQWSYCLGARTSER
jgi:hypothetical protein